MSYFRKTEDGGYSSNNVFGTVLLVRGVAIEFGESASRVGDAFSGITGAYHSGKGPYKALSSVHYSQFNTEGWSSNTDSRKLTQGGKPVGLQFQDRNWTDIATGHSPGSHRQGEVAEYMQVAPGPENTTNTCLR